jgi:hypothetical protein
MRPAFIGHIGLILVAAAFAAPAGAECFTVLQRGAIVYRSDVPPIDLSGPIHVALQKRFPAAQLVISDDNRNCNPIDPARPIDPLTGGPPATPGGPRAGLSVVPGPLETMTTNPVTAGAPIPEQQASDVGCRRGGTVTRRGAPCPDTEVVVPQRVVGARDAPPATAPVEPTVRERAAIRGR